MSDFDDAMDDAAGDMLAAFVDDVTYIKVDSTEIPGQAAINENREIMGGDYQSSYLSTTFTFKAGLVDAVNRGDRIVHKGKSWIVEAPLSEDSHFIEVIVK